MAVLAVVLGLAVLLMHTGAGPGAHAPRAHAAGHIVEHAGHTVDHVAERAVTKSTVEHAKFEAVHDRHAHSCAGTVVTAKPVGAPSLVAVLPISDLAGSAALRERAAAARGPPPWSVLSLSELCVLRV